MRGDAAKTYVLGSPSKYSPAPTEWSSSCTNTECSLHQLSPYIGKLKSSIASELITSFSAPQDLVMDPFCGSGTVPLEAVLHGRRVFASDVSPYGKVLTLAKLSAPASLSEALELAETALRKAKQEPRPDLRRVPRWVRSFFHPETLREILQFSALCKRERQYFLFACLLGILHHQRPGFLSYPSSHLVPYLRDKLFPRSDCPAMYEYRELRSRLLAKVRRAYARKPDFQSSGHYEFRQGLIENVAIPEHVDCIITSPPYMNALDYGRDNRLRLWVINPQHLEGGDTTMTRSRKAFLKAMRCLARKVEFSLRPGGACVLVVGEAVSRSYAGHPAEAVLSVFGTEAPSLHLKQALTDAIPDVRRSRRKYRGTKSERVLVFRKKKR